MLVLIAIELTRWWSKYTQTFEIQLRLRVLNIASKLMSNSYTFDPAAGQSVPTESIGAGGDASNEPSAQDSAHLSAELSRRDTAAFLASQHNSPAEIKSDAPSGDLLSLQRELSAAADRGDHLAVERLELQCYQLASGLIGAKAPKAPLPQDVDVEDTESITEAYVNKFPNIREELSTVAEEWSTETSEGINQILDQGEELSSSLALNLVHQYSKTPEAFTDSHVELRGDQANEIISQFGQMGQDVVTISAAIAAGQATTADAIRLCSKKPELMQTMMECAKQGLITIAV